MAPGDYGWFVTLSDYKPNARKFLDDNPQISGINGSQPADLIMKYYSDMSDKYTRIIPLKRVYIPVLEEE